MDVGMMMIFAAYGWENIGDDQVWEEELRLARQAADLGFDVLWSAEHHFFDYSFCPDNLQLMTYLAGACPNTARRATGGGARSSVQGEAAAWSRPRAGAA